MSLTGSTCFRTEYNNIKTIQSKKECIYTSLYTSVDLAYFISKASNNCFPIFFTFANNMTLPLKLQLFYCCSNLNYVIFYEYPILDVLSCIFRKTNISALLTQLFYIVFIFRYSFSLSIRKEEPNDLMQRRKIEWKMRFIYRKITNLYYQFLDGSLMGS